MNEFKIPRISQVFEGLPKRPQVYCGSHDYMLDDKRRLTIPATLRNNPNILNNDEERRADLQLGVLALPKDLLDDIFGPLEQSSPPDPIASLLLSNDLELLLEGANGECFAPYADFAGLDAQKRVTIRTTREDQLGSKACLLGRVNRFDLSVLPSLSTE